MKTAAKLLIMTLFLAIVAPSLCLAANDVELRTEIEKMLVMTKMDKMMDPMFAQIEEMMNNQVTTMGISEEQLPIVEQYNNQISDLLRSELAWEKIRNQYIDLYAKVYTIAEIKSLSEFYSSATGQKMLEKMPQLTQEAMTLAHTNLQSLFPQIQEISEKMMLEIQPEQQPTAPQQ